MRKADKSGNLNFLEPSGPLQACNGTALPSNVFMLTVYCKVEYHDAYVFIADYAVSQFVESLRHKTEGRGFDSRWFL